MKIFVSQSLVEVEALKSRLEEAGIACFVKNRSISSLAGAVPFAEVFPELWVTHQKDAHRAQELLDEWKAEGETADPDWTCGRCCERHEGQFTTCWKCGAERDQPQTGGAVSPAESNDDRKRSFSTAGFLFGGILGAVTAVASLSLVNYFNAPDDTMVDRNGDRQMDVVYSYQSILPVPANVPTGVKLDDNFDGVYDTFYTYDRNGYPVEGKIDRDQDGKPDILEYYRYGVLQREEFLDKESGKVIKRLYYGLGKRSVEEVDRDGDGRFETTVYFDNYEFPEDKLTGSGLEK